MHAEARAIEVAGVAAGERSKMERGSHCQNFKCFWRWWRYHAFSFPLKKVQKEKSNALFVALDVQKIPKQMKGKEYRPDV